MNTRHILLCLALSLLGAGLKAQNDLPQVFSPNAAELGKYGKIPVSYFNGLPNISIPLTELRAKGYTLPIYLTYHAGGNKPDQHPGWVGLGWTLHAGGCINRIVNGMKDEMTKEERGALTGATPQEHPGYLFQRDCYYNKDWTQASLLDSLINSLHYTDGCPDEFQVNIEGLNASFYFTGNNEIQIVSKEDDTFSVEYEISSGYDETFPLMGTSRDYDDLSVKKMSYLKGFIITKNDGTKYYFGGNDSYIEFEVSQNGDKRYISGIPSTDHGWNGIALANTWMLREIKRPNGESIFFEYERKGTPIVRQDAHSIQYKFINGAIDEVTSTLDQSGRQYCLNIHYTFLKPLYLKSIHCKLSDDRLEFENEKTTELSYKIESSEFITRLGRPAPFDTLSKYNYFCQLSAIKSERGNEIDFNYTENDSERLKLISVVFKNENLSVSRYRFFYNPEPLPDYNARMSDIWGYYMGTQYRVEDFYSTVPGEVINQEVADAARRHVNARYLRAEILDSLVYPTGGWTKLEYEPHTYSKVADQFPFEIQCQEGMAGGLRVKRITNGLPNGKTEQRSFVYDDNNVSTGVLSGNPTSVLKGYHNVNNHYGFWQWDFPTSIFPIYLSGSLVYDCKYIIYAERYLNQLSTTSGSHVTYSKVTEYNSTDESGQVEYYYSNHDTHGCMDFSPTSMYGNLDNTIIQENINSMELSRGNLIKKIIRNADGQIALQEDNIYYSDTLDYIPMLHRNIVPIGNYSRITYSKVFSFYPKLTRKIVTIYPDGCGSPHVDTTQYTYDTYRNLTEVSRSSYGQTDVHHFSFPGNYPDSPLYSAMSASGRHAIPVEQIHSMNGLISEAELTTWKLENGFFVPSEKWTAGLGAGISPSAFQAFDGTSKDSHYGSTPDLSFTKYDGDCNLILSEDREGLPTTYFWTPDGCHPAAIFKGAKNGTRQEITQVVVASPVSSDLNELSGGSSIDLEFLCDLSGEVTVYLNFIKEYGQTVWWRIDYGTEHRWDWPALGPEEELEIQTLFSGVLPAGNHIFQLTNAQGSFTELADDEEEDDSGQGPMTTVLHHTSRSAQPQLPSWGSITLTYPAIMLRPHEVRADECLFESFGPDDNGLQEGFDGGGTFTGVKTLDFVPYPNKTYTIDWQEWQPDGTWAYRSKTVPGTGTFTAGTVGKVMDHVRVFPQGTQVESYTWDAAGNLLSRTDARGVTESYRYDGLGRLTGVYDNDGKKVEGYQYNYKNR